MGGATKLECPGHLVDATHARHQRSALARQPPLHKRAKGLIPQFNRRRASQTSSTTNNRTEPHHRTRNGQHTGRRGAISDHTNWKDTARLLRSGPFRSGGQGAQRVRELRPHRTREAYRAVMLSQNGDPYAALPQRSPSVGSTAGHQGGTTNQCEHSSPTTGDTW
jgi:hypothetical protein